ncbi:MAG: hypothetical protein H7249_00815 [Chitinophagaceae bacterium]|nr:hypothetical protein [Oligoflexus sp.]
MKALVIASMTVLLAQGVAMAKGAAHPKAEKAAALSIAGNDKDGDGKLSPTEAGFADANDPKFKALDKDSSGFIEASELDAHAKAPHSK